MSLIAIRRLMRDQEGLWDLVNEDYTDNGANALINTGQRFLDLRVKGRPDGRNRFVKDIAAGDFLLVIPELRAAERVEIMDSTGARAPLAREEHLALRQEFGEEFGSGTQSRPVWWAQVTAALPAPSQADLGQGGYQDEASGDLADMLIEDCESGVDSQAAILMLPRADAIYTISVFGTFYSKKLVADTDKTFWTERFPDTLLAAAMMHAEIRKRNTEGTKDWLAAIDLALDGMDRESVRTELATSSGRQKAH